MFHLGGMLRIVTGSDLSVKMEHQCDWDIKQAVLL